MKKEATSQTNIFLNYDKHGETSIASFKEPQFNIKDNLVIEGDNLDILNALLPSHKNAIDVIYIDPPYNTKKNHFKYSDNMSHQEWCSFMHQRLVIAKELLSSSGSIFISIGDQAYAYLKIVCDEIFGEENFVANFIWKKSHTFKNDSQSISTQHEYILCFAKDKRKVFFNQDEVSSSYIDKAYRYVDEKGRFRVVPLFKEKNKNSFKVVSPNGTEWTRNWNYNEKSFQNLMDNNLVYFGKDGNACPSKKVYFKENMTKTFGSLLNPEKTKYTGDGVKELKRLGFVSTDFLYPKPVELIVHVLEIASKKNSIILDFFAGSGTTGQAVMELNKRDHGTRNFILGTNNENHICEEITIPRLLKAKDLYHFEDNFFVSKIPS